MRYVIVFLVLFFPGAIVAGSDGLVVIVSNHPDLPAGAIVEKTMFIDMSQGESIKLVSSSGQVVRLQGPYSGKVVVDSQQKDRSLLESVSGLVKDSKPTDFTLAVFRKPPSSKIEARLDIWGIDIRKPATYCVRSDQPVYLWWPRSLPDKEVTVSSSLDSKKVRFEWPANKTYHLWPETVDLNEQVEYSIEGDPGVPTGNFDIRIMPENIESKMEQVAWMANRNCETQATRLLSAVLSGDQ